MPDDERRFTDREVALILKQASELDEEAGAERARGLTREELVEIAREAGISPESMRAAVARVEAGGGAPTGLALAPRSHRAVRAVEGALDREAQSRLVSLLDERATDAGTVSEALGSVRWTSQGRFRSLQVTLTPEGDETAIQVAERATSRLMRATHMAPTAAGFMVATGVLGALDPSSAGMLAGMAAGIGAGLGAGRLAWNWLSRKSAERVERLAATLAGEARDASRSLPSGTSEDPDTP